MHSWSWWVGGSHEEEYSHGFLIPIVAAWLLWTRRDALRASIGRPVWTGPILILFAMVMHVVNFGLTFFLSQAGFVLLLIGLVLALGGYSLLRTAFIPIIFLLFAIPMPKFIDSTMSLQLQFISSELGTQFIRMFQIPVYLDGNIIDLGYYKIQVVEACSGLRYLYPLLSLGFLAAYFFQAPLWQRAIVFFSSIPITIAMNGLRIGLVGVTVDYWSTQAADGLLHFFEGWVIFLACAGLLALEISFLARLSRKTFFEVFYPPSVVAQPPRRGSQAQTGDRAPLVTSLSLLCAVGAAAIYTSGRPEIIPDRSRFVAFPETIGPWQGRTFLLDPESERRLRPDDYILSDYKRSDGNVVNLYVVYYASQKNGIPIHSPKLCIPANGWQISKFEQTSYTDNGAKLPLNRVIIEKNLIKQVVFYWFDERGRKFANEYLAGWYLHADAMVMNRTDGALIRLITQIHDGESERDADERLQAFIRDAVPTLSEYLPSDANSLQLNFRPKHT